MSIIHILHDSILVENISDFDLYVAKGYNLPSFCTDEGCSSHQRQIVGHQAPSVAIRATYLQSIEATVLYSRNND